VSGFVAFSYPTLPNTNLNRNLFLFIGSDGSIFPPFVTRDRIIEIFSPDMCRSIYMTYVKDVELLGIEAYRFSTPKEVLEDPRVFKENKCYCVKPGENDEGCSKGGAFQLGACRKGQSLDQSIN